MSDDPDFAVFCSQMRDLEERFQRPGLADQVEAYVRDLRAKLAKRNLDLAVRFSSDDEAIVILTGDYRLLMPLSVFITGDFNAELSIAAVVRCVTGESNPPHAGFYLNSFAVSSPPMRQRYRDRRDEILRIVWWREFWTCILLVVVSVAILRFVF